MHCRLDTFKAPQQARRNRITNAQAINANGRQCQRSLIRPFENVETANGERKGRADARNPGCEVRRASPVRCYNLGSNWRVVLPWAMVFVQCHVKKVR